MGENWGAGGAPLAKLAAVFLVATGLSGCVAAALPLLVAGGGSIGFTGYKLVQTESGGSVGIQLPSKDGKELPPDPLPPAKRIAIWPGGGNVRFAESLTKSGHFTVTSPSKVSATLTKAHISPDPKTLTDEEQDASLARLCKSLRTDLVFVSVARPPKTDTNTFSLSRATITYPKELAAYSRKEKRAIWHDAVSLVLEVGGKSPPSDDELNRIVTDAWVDRVLQAMSLPVPEKGAV